MGNSFQQCQKNLFEKCHKSRQLPEAHDAFEDEALLKPDFSKEHQISLRLVSYKEGDPVSSDEITHQFQRYFTKSLYMQRLRSFAEKPFKPLVKKDRLHKWKSLKQINIYLSNKYDGSFLVLLADFIITQLPDLHGIKLAYNKATFSGNGNLNGESLKNFVEKVTKHMPRLKRFEIFMSHLSPIRNSHVKSIIRQILRNLPHLEVLSLHFET